MICVYKRLWKSRNTLESLIKGYFKNNKKSKMFLKPYLKSMNVVLAIKKEKNHRWKITSVKRDPYYLHSTETSNLLK